MPKKLVFMIGAPGSGKSTFSDRINEMHPDDIDCMHVGDLLREEIAKGTTIGKIVEPFIRKGDLVPGEIIIYEVFGRIRKSPKDIVLLDGFPRGLNQMKILGDALVYDKGIELVSVIELQVSKDKARKRLLPENPSSEEEEIFEHKFEVYEDIIDKIEEFYKKDNLLKVINAEQDSEKVLEEIDRHLKSIVELH